MKILVTGGTGLIGNDLVRTLVQRGHEVRALVRSPERARRLLPGEVTLIEGDVTVPQSLEPACQGVERVFHAAGIPEQWQADDSIFDRVNRGGTVNVLTAALRAGVKRVIYTSTMDVFAAPPGGTLVESNLDPHPKHTAYERSKQAAEQEAERIRQQGLDVVYVNPGAVYGPGPVHEGTNSFFIKLMNRDAPLLPPGGMALAFVRGVTAVHLAAADRGQSGDRFLVADTHATNRELAQAIAAQVPGLKVPPVGPAWALRALATVSAPLARTFGFRPLIALGQLQFLLWNVRVDASKAIRELDFVPTSLEEGVRETIAALREQGLVPRA